MSVYNDLDKAEYMSLVICIKFSHLEHQTLERMILKDVMFFFNYVYITFQNHRVSKYSGI